MIKRSLLFTLFLFLAFTSFAQVPNASPKREFRGVWLATVANIDWPSKPGLSTEIQKKELLRIFDDHERSGINAIMMQIRPSTDALYGKGREMWSRFLTGKQGLAPSPYYDPLEFAIEEAHKRGMELHAWFNPYRATFDLVESNTDPQHITRQKPEWFFTYEGKKLFNPGIPEVQEYIVQIIMDVVRNYDVDGIHFDDYFYPYPDSKNRPLPDTDSFSKYGAHKFSNIADWRRNNVDTLIQTLNDSIHTEKSYVKFGVSPFGIWRNLSQDPEGSQSNGFDGYGKLYADARKWTQAGWVDYINPQLYFPFFYTLAPYEKLLDWWSNNTYGRHLYIGQAAYRAAENREGWRNRQQLPDQIRYLRNNTRVQGSVFFSSKSLSNNLAGVTDSLRRDFYRYPALQPAMLWLDDVDPNPPKEVTATALNNCVDITWKAPTPASDGQRAYGYVIYRFNEGEEIRTSQAANILKISFDASKTSYSDFSVAPGTRYTYVVTAIDRLKNESVDSMKVGIQTGESTNQVATPAAAGN